MGHHDMAVVVSLFRKPKKYHVGISIWPAVAAVRTVFESFIFPIHRSHARVCSSTHINMYKYIYYILYYMLVDTCIGVQKRKKSLK